jgi:hypothetical protein
LVAALRDGVNHAARRATELRRVAARLDLDFFDEVDDHVLARGAVLQVGGLDAVDDVAVLAGAGAVDREAAALVSWLAPGACVTRVVKSRPFGSNSTCSARMFVARELWRTSISGVPR